MWIFSPIQDALQVSMLQACPLRPPSEGEGTYAFEGYIQVHERLAPREKLGELLDGFRQSPEPDQVLFASVIRVMAYLDEIPVEIMWEPLMDVLWRDSVLRQGS